MGALGYKVRDLFWKSFEIIDTLLTTVELCWPMTFEIHIRIKHHYLVYIVEWTIGS